MSESNIGLWVAAICFAFVIGSLMGANCDPDVPFKMKVQPDPYQYSTVYLDVKREVSE